MVSRPELAKRHPWHFSLPTLFALVTLVSLMCGMCRMVSKHITLLDVSPSLANTALYETVNFGRIPDSASHVDVHARFQGFDASLDIDEAEFLAWVKPNWKIQDVNLAGTPTMVVRHYPSDWPTAVTSAYYFENIAPRGSGWQIMFDRNQKRAWVSYSPR
jgi:hypothetical protein